jgi:type VI secretion system secreted protein VgrG
MKFLIHAVSYSLLFIAVQAKAAAIDVNLGSAGGFAVLAGTTVTNTGPSVILGNVGVGPGTAVTGFSYISPGVGTVYAGDAAATQAESDLTTAYNFAAAETGGTSLTGQDLGGMTLSAGVYVFASSAQLTGTLILDAHGDANAVFIFQIGSTLTTASNASIEVINGGSANNVFFQVGSSATLGTGTDFEGNILALTSITMTTGSSIGCGRALALNGAVTMDTNDVSISGTNCGTVADTSSAVSEPNSAAIMIVGLLCVIGGAQFARCRAQP